MVKQFFALVGIVSLLVMSACSVDPLTLYSGSGGKMAATGGHTGTGGRTGTGGNGGQTGFVIPLPDGGLSLLLGDGGLLAGILDAPRDNVLGRIICGPEVRLGGACSTSDVGCLLPSLGGACACVSGFYLCPTNTAAGPTTCPAGAVTGSSCLTLLSTCIGGSANACVCGLGTYTCF